MTRLKLFLTTLVMAVGILAMIASPASAHYTPYQGHECDYSGGNYKCWHYSWDGCAWEVLFDGRANYACGHWHRYSHFRHGCWEHMHALSGPHTATHEDPGCYG